MKEILLIIGFLAVAAFGFFLMAKLDKFLEENRKVIAEEADKKRKPYIILSNTATEEDMIGEINQFRRDHSCAYVVVCDPSEADYIALDALQSTKTIEKEVHADGKTKCKR